MPISLFGYDQEGRKIVFECSYSDANEANLYYSPLTSEITADHLIYETDQITFTLYGSTFPKENGRMNPSEKWSHEFIVDMK